MKYIMPKGFVSCLCGEVAMKDAKKLKHKCKDKPTDKQIKKWINGSYKQGLELYGFFGTKEFERFYKQKVK